MSATYKCRQCGGNVVYPAYDGDGAYPIPPMCRCPENQPNPKRTPKEGR